MLSGLIDKMNYRPTSGKTAYLSIFPDEFPKPSSPSANFQTCLWRSNFPCVLYEVCQSHSHTSRLSSKGTGYSQLCLVNLPIPPTLSPHFQALSQSVVFQNPTLDTMSSQIIMSLDQKSITKAVGNVYIISVYISGN